MIISYTTMIDNIKITHGIYQILWVIFDTITRFHSLPLYTTKHLL